MGGCRSTRSDGIGPVAPAPARSRPCQGLARATIQRSTASSDSGLASESRDATSALLAPSSIFFSGTSSFLPDNVRGTDGIGVDQVGDVAWGELGAQRVPQPRPQLVVDRRPVGGGDEQDQLAGPALVVLEVDDDAVGDLVEPLDDGVEVARPEPDAAAVEGGVRPPADLARPVVEERDPVAVAPDTRERGVVGRPEPLAGRVAPQRDRHRRHRRRDHELPGLAGFAALAGGVERLDVASEHARGDLAGAHGFGGRRADERRADVGASAHRPGLDLPADGVDQPLEPLRRQRRPGRAEVAQTAQVDLVAAAAAPAFRQAITNGALTPRTSTASSRRHARARAGRGRPGRRRTARSSSRRGAPTRAGSTSSSRSW